MSKTDLDQIILDLTSAGATRHGLLGSLLGQAKQIVSLVAGEERIASLEIVRADEALPKPWRDVATATVPSRKRNRVVGKGTLVGVAGLGKRTEKNPDGAVQQGWRITRIQERDGAVNVDVVRNGAGRTFPIDKIR